MLTMIQAPLTSSIRPSTQGLKPVNGRRLCLKTSTRTWLKLGLPSKVDLRVMCAASKSSVVDKAVIIGGGIGGLATAVALHKLGIHATVYEKALAAERQIEAGTMVSLSPNGMQALRAIDPSIPIKMKGRGATSTRAIMFTETGEVKSDTATPASSDVVLLQWSRILEVLQEYLPPSCILSGYTCTAITEVDGEVQVSVVKDGETTVVKAPLVIGADGVRSKVRDYVLGANPIAARDLGRRCWRAMIPYSSLAKSIPENTVMSVLAEGKNAMIATLGSEQVYWAIVAVDEYGGAERSVSLDAMKARVKAFFPHLDFLQTAIEATSAEDILERRIIDIPELPTWSKGRVLLIGDAAHAIPPALGQGANLALEDALELARQLLASSRVEEAVANYTAERRPRVKAVVDMNAAGVKAAYGKRNLSTIDQDLVSNYGRLKESLIKV